MKIERIKRMMAEARTIYVKRGKGFSPVTVIDYHLSSRFIKVLPQSAKPSFWIEPKALVLKRPRTRQEVAQSRRISNTLRLLNAPGIEWMTARQFAKKAMMKVGSFPRCAGAWLSYLARKGLVERESIPLPNSESFQQRYRLLKPVAALPL